MQELCSDGRTCEVIRTIKNQGLKLVLKCYISLPYLLKVTSERENVVKRRKKYKIQLEILL